MSLYPFAPSPTFGLSEHRITLFENAFDDEEISRLISYCEELDKRDARVGGLKEPVNYIRTSTVSWIKLTSETTWMYDKLANIVRHLNGKYYGFELYGFHDDLQYTVYNGSDNDHYTWHLDNGGKTDAPPRKLSVVLQLSDPNEYAGGELEVFVKANPMRTKKQKGLVVAFPSFTLHRVTPVTSGVRRTLVAWVCGPAFR